MFQEMDEALYEDCRVRFEDDEVRVRVRSVFASSPGHVYSVL